MKRTRKKYRDLTNEKFGRLTVLYRAPNSDTRHAMYFVECKCGSGTKIVRGTSLTSGFTKSCGCYQRECAAKRGPENTKHGCARRSEQPIKEYSAWRDARHYHDGVTYDFSRFYSLVGPAPEGRSRLCRTLDGAFKWV